MQLTYLAKTGIMPQLCSKVINTAELVQVVWLLVFLANLANTTCQNKGILTRVPPKM
jgi:hypothetical protein